MLVQFAFSWCDGAHGMLSGPVAPSCWGRYIRGLNHLKSICAVYALFATDDSDDSYFWVVLKVACLNSTRVA